MSMKVKKTMSFALVFALVISIFSIAPMDTYAAAEAKKLSPKLVNTGFYNIVNWNYIKYKKGEKIAKYYELKRDTKKNGKYKKVIYKGSYKKKNSSVSVRDTSAKLGKTYYYKVIAYDKKGKGKKQVSSSRVKAVTGGSSGNPIITKIAEKDGNVELSWTVFDGASGYVIYRSEEGAAYTKYTTINDNKVTANPYGKTWTDTDVKEGTKYSYRIRAFREQKAQKVKLKGPSLKLKTLSNKKVKITWKKRAGATEYVVKKSVNGKAFKDIKTFGPKARSYTDKKVNLKKNKYSYSVAAFKNIKEGTFWSKDSKVFSITTRVTPPTPEPADKQ